MRWISLQGGGPRPAGVAGTNPPYVRRAVFEKALRLVEEREQEITELIVAELGGTRLKAAFELHLVKEFLRESVHLTLSPQGTILPSPGDGKENRVYRVPVGVVGVISPFNFPLPPVGEVGRPGPRARQRRGAQAAPEHSDRRRHPGREDLRGRRAARRPAQRRRHRHREIGDAFIEHPRPPR